MARCEQCGNDYDKSFEVRMAGRTMIFDSFECAIQALARRPAPIAAAASSGMVSNMTAPSSAACTALRRKA
jgi:hypothetical protein